MPRYLIELTHADERTACVKALQALERHGSHLVTHADWGCHAGVHCGWLIVELDSRTEATMIMPPEFRDDARIVELNRFTRNEVVSWVAEHAG